MTGIMKANAELAKVGTAFVCFGDKGTGKTFQAATRTKDLNPLFIVFGNGDTVNLFENASYAENPTVAEVESFIKGFEGNSAEFKQYGSVVLDGLFGYATAVLQNIAGNNVQQHHWGLMGKTIQLQIERLKRSRPLIGATILTALNAEGVREATLNPDLFNRVVGYFSKVIYTAAKAGVNGAEYNVQDEAIAALNFKPKTVQK
jgi:hypothetical protein